MSTPFQNRLVGTIIVTAAIVIFLPGILDGEKKSYQSDFDNIPKTPVFTGKISNNKFPTSLKPKSEKKKLSDDTAQDDALNLSDVTPEVNASNSNKLAASTIVTPIKRSDPKETDNKLKPITETTVSTPATSSSKSLPPKATVNEAWVIQLGSFKNKKNVEQLTAKLKLNGYVVFTKPIQTQKGSLIKVFVGPELIKSSMVKKIPHLKTLTGVTGKIANFQPTQ